MAVEELRSGIEGLHEKLRRVDQMLIDDYGEGLLRFAKDDL